MRIHTAEEAAGTIVKSAMTAMTAMTATLIATLAMLTILARLSGTVALTGTKTAIGEKVMTASTRTENMREATTRSDITIATLTSEDPARREGSTREGLDMSKEPRQVATRQTAKEARAANTHPPKRLLLPILQNSILERKGAALARTLTLLTVPRMLGSFEVLPSLILDLD